MKNFKYSRTISFPFFLIFSLIPFSLFSGPFSLPQPKELFQMVQESDYIAKATIDKIEHKTIKPGILSAHCEITIKRALKAKFPLPPKIELSFIVNQRQYGKSLVSLPEKGEYILFMNQKVFKDASGKSFETIVLYEPHPFAIQDFNANLENRIIELVK